MEKTFEELILSGKDEHASVTVRKCLELMQQVREATIAECEERIIELEGEIYREGITGVFDVFPTDRITITDND